MTPYTVHTKPEKRPISLAKSTAWPRMIRVSWNGVQRPDKNTYSESKAAESFFGQCEVVFGNIIEYGLF